MNAIYDIFWMFVCVLAVQGAIDVANAIERHFKWMKRDG